MSDLVSRKTRTDFREALVSFYVLRQIADEFDAAGVFCDLDHVSGVSGERRTLVEQYYATVDWGSWSHVRKVLDVYEHILISLEDRAADVYGGTTARETITKLVRYLNRDGFAFEGGRISRIGKHVELDHVSAAANRLDAPELHRQIARINSSIEEDPSLAVGTAKELLESVARTILHERDIDAGDDWDLNRLVGAAREVLVLLPEQTDQHAKGAAAIKRLLGQLGAVVQSVAELRNLYGTGHGKVGSRRGIHPRHARLVVGSAATLATFLLEAHDAGRGR